MGLLASGKSTRYLFCLFLCLYRSRLFHHSPFSNDGLSFLHIFCLCLHCLGYTNATSFLITLAVSHLLTISLLGMFALVKALSTILSLVFLIDRLGRRKLLLVSSIGTALALWYIGAFVEAANIDLSKPQGKSVAGWVAIVCVYIYAVSSFFFLF